MNPNPVFFYCAALGAFVVGVLCMVKTSTHSSVGGDMYERRKNRRIAGQILMIAGALLVGIAIMSQYNPPN
jgi:drug/metabolite transporter (DMT)-like permease